jgi:phosphoribosylformylglycinamidine cyclo-ligase
VIVDYKESGVDIEAGKSFVYQIKDTVKSTHKPEVLGGFGGFNGMMKIPSKYKNPILVSGTDGVGSKLNLARLEGNHNLEAHYGVGIDLVAMCVNDVITCGAEPLFFLDYIATGKLNPNHLVKVVDGIAEGCRISECSLLGGETAEVPSIYDPKTNVYDLAGFCVGVVEEDKIIDGRNVKSGDKVIGIESSGVHSNGFSLINNWIFKTDRDKYNENLIANVLLAPTIIYAPLVKTLLNLNIPINGMANITGGGIPENLPRCLPGKFEVDVDYNSWERPEIFKMIQEYMEVEENEMRNVFNLGIGYCLVVPSDVVSEIIMVLHEYGLGGWVIGEVK